MSATLKSKIQSFYRIVKAQSGHQFAGLYAVEKVYFKNGAFQKKQIAHEWDLRIISESILARLGGQDAYESFKMDNDMEDEALEPQTVDAEARTAEEIALSKTKLKKELRLDTKAE